MKNAASDLYIQLCYRGRDHLNVIFVTGDDSESYKGFKINLMNILDETRGDVNINFGCEVQMDSAEFSKIIRDTAQFSNALSISKANDRILFTSDDDEDVTTI